MVCFVGKSFGVGFPNLRIKGSGFPPVSPVPDAGTGTGPITLSFIGATLPSVGTNN